MKHSDHLRDESWAASHPADYSHPTDLSALEILLSGGSIAMPDGRVLRLTAVTAIPTNEQPASPFALLAGQVPEAERYTFREWVAALDGALRQIAEIATPAPKEADR